MLSGSLVVAEDFLTITSFPATLNLTTQSLGEALGVDPTTITYGDTFNFVAKSMRNDGTMFYGQAPSFDDSTNTVGLGNTESNLTNIAAYKSAMSFGFIVSCPFVQAEMLGTYDVVFDDGFVGASQDFVFDVVAGANANQVIMLDPYGSFYSPLDIVVDVDDFGIATVDRQAAFGTDEVCCAGYSLTYVETYTTSLALSCIGYIDLKLSTGLGIPPSTSGYTFGDTRFIAQKTIKTKKKMKNLNLLFLLIPAMFLTSCGEDDYSEAYVDTEAKTNLVATLEVNRTKAAAGTQIDAMVTLPQAFDVASTVTVRAINSNSGDYTVGTVSFEAGQTMASGAIIMPANIASPGTFYGTDASANIMVTGVALAEGNDPFTLTSNAISLTLIDSNSWNGNADQVLKVALDWSGPYGDNDIDLYILDLDFNTYEDSASGSRFEGDWFNNPANENHPDGDYLLLIDIWSAAGVVDYNLQLTHPSGTVDMYEGDLVAEDGYIIPVGFTKTTVDGVSSYVTYAF